MARRRLKPEDVRVVRQNGASAPPAGTAAEERLLRRVLELIEQQHMPEGAPETEAATKPAATGGFS